MVSQIRSEKGTAIASLERDKVLERGKDPKQIPVYGLNKHKIRSWWKQWNKDQDKQWSTLTCNCSTVVKEALCQGGVLSILS